MRQTIIITFKDGQAEECCYTAWMLLCDYLEEKGVLDSLVGVLPRMSRVWTEIVTTPQGQKCVGFATLAQVWDVSNCHCEDDRSRARLMQRIATVLEEHVGERTCALVYVDPHVEKDWSPMLEGMGAKRAHRWAVPAGATLQEGGLSVLRPEHPAAVVPGHAVESDSSADNETERSA